MILDIDDPDILLRIKQFIQSLEDETESKESNK